MELLLPTKIHHFPHYNHHHHCSRRRRFLIVHSNSTNGKNNKSSGNSTPAPVSDNPAEVTALGFGAATPISDANANKKKGKTKSVIRRSPIPSISSSSGDEKGTDEQKSANESAFLLTWLGLGGIILIQGLLLAASGFLPDEWDNFFVKYLYPSFTPTVFLFVAGTVAYGVLKYLEGEKTKS